MQDKELRNFIERKVRSGIGAKGGELSRDRQRNMEEYLGDEYGNEREGRSQVVTREAQEVVKWIMPALMKIFAASQIVKFDPHGPEDEDAAELETDYVNHLFKNVLKGFEALYTWMKGALIYKNSYLKAYESQNRKVATESYQGLNQLEIASLVDDPDYSIESYEETQGQDAMGNPIPLYNVEGFRTTSQPKICLDVIPPEDLVVDDLHSDLSLEDCSFVAHVDTTKTLSDLREMGFDEELVASVETSPSMISEEHQTRHFHEGLRHDNNEDPSQKRVELIEAYVKVDYDGDGIAERRQVFMVGDVILSNRRFPSMPIFCLTPNPVPHKHIGLSMVDLVSDIQKIKTQLTRQLLDNLHHSNEQRPVASSLTVDSDSLMSDDFGEPVWVDHANPLQQVGYLAKPVVIGETLTALQYLDSQKEMRSGVSNTMTNVDPDVLSNATMGAYLKAADMSSVRIEEVARIFAETGVKDFFAYLRELIIKTGTSTSVKLRHRWYTIDPASWGPRQNVEVVVGLGHNSRDQMISYLLGLAEKQELHLTQGSPLVRPENLYATYEEISELVGAGDPRKYWTNPAENPPVPQSDPQADLMQAQLELAQEQLRLQAEKQQLEAKERDIQLQIKAAELQQKARENAIRLELEGQKEDDTIRLKEEELAIKRDHLKLEQAELEAKVEGVKQINVDKSRIEHMRYDDERKRTAEAAPKLVEAQIKAVTKVVEEGAKKRQELEKSLLVEESKAKIKMAEKAAEKELELKKKVAEAEIAKTKKKVKRKIKLTETADGIEGTSEVIE